MLQILSGVEDFTYQDRSGRKITKSGDEYLSLLEESFHLPQGLRDLGIPTEVICPVMDHELLRPKELGTQNNFQKARDLVKKLTEQFGANGPNYSVTVVSSLLYFGVPEDSKYYKSIRDTVLNSERNEYGISNQTLMHQIDSNYKRNINDTERADYYRSREFAHLYTVSGGLGENYFHAMKMQEKATESNNSGVIVKLQQGDHLASLVYKLAKQLVVYY